MSQSKPAIPAFGTAEAGSFILWQAIYVATAILSGLGILGKISLLKGLIPLPTPLLVIAVCTGICLPLAWPLALRIRFILAPLALLGLVFASLVLFPKIQQLHSIGRGTDQPDCVIVAADGMMSQQWPYQRDKLWTHNSMSCGPGWVAIQAPLVRVLGYRWDLIGVWAVSLAVCVWVQGWNAVSALLALLCICPGFWLAASDGTDFLPFGIALAALVAATAKLRRGSVVFVLIAGMLAQFRFPMLLLPAFFTKQMGKVAALSATVLGVVSQMAFLIWNPSSYIGDGPMFVLSKLTGRHLFSTNPTLACLEIGVPALLAAYAISSWEERSPHRWALFIYIYAIFFPPAILDLIHKMALYSEPLKALGFWEGGMWMVALLPLATMVIARASATPRLQITSPSETRKLSSSADLLAPASSLRCSSKVVQL
jgi:hypothetical protein